VKKSTKGAASDPGRNRQKLRLAPTVSTLRALFARSGNRCAFPGCTHELIDHNNQFVGQVCHIEAAEVGGPRFNAEQSGEERRSSSNLLLLCYRHHKESDNEKLYPVSKLRAIKGDHEKRYGRKMFNIDESVLASISQDVLSFWKDVEKIDRSNQKWRSHPLSVEVNPRPSDLFEQIYLDVMHVERLTKHLSERDDQVGDELNNLLTQLAIPLSILERIPYYKNPFTSGVRNFEFHKLGIPNTLKILRLHLYQMEIQFYEHYLKLNPDDIASFDHFERLKRKFKKYLKEQGLYD
jgi:hypothetical protein